MAAILIAHVMKTIPALAQDDEKNRKPLLAGIRKMLTLYIASTVKT